MFGLARFKTGKTVSARQTAAKLRVVRSVPEKTPFAEPEPQNIRVSADRVLFEERASFGTVFVVYLGEFFRALGGRTDRFSDALQLMAEAIFREQLSPEDKFSFHPHGYFTLQIADTDQSAARDTAEALVDRLGMRAVGDRYVSWQNIHTMEETRVA
jgi:hypothetical protein